MQQIKIKKSESVITPEKPGKILPRNTSLLVPSTSLLEKTAQKRNNANFYHAHATSHSHAQTIPSNTFLKSFVFAFQGIKYVLRTQRNMRVHFGAGVLVIIAGVIFGVSTAEWAALLVIMALVYSLEMLNTVAEAIVDMVTQEYHPLAKVAKDVAAGAVLLSALFAFAIACVIFLPRFLHFVFTLLGWG
jgi:diacylglycerol kinase